MQRTMRHLSYAPPPSSPELHPMSCSSAWEDTGQQCWGTL